MPRSAAAQKVRANRALRNICAPSSVMRSIESWRIPAWTGACISEIIAACGWHVICEEPDGSRRQRAQERA